MEMNVAQHKDAAAILEGIKAYRPQQEEIMGAIKKHGGVMTQGQFDAEFGEFEEHRLNNGDVVMSIKPPVIRAWGYSRKAFLLGGMGDARSMSDWGKMLHLTQLMADAGLIRISGTPPNIQYSAT